MRQGEVVRPDGVRIAYDVSGSGPVVLFLHGLTNRRNGWDPISSLLTGRFTCARVDLRGHGASSTATDYGMLTLVGDVHAVVDDLGLDDVAVVGHSLGATVGAVYAAVHGARAAVCVDQGLRFGDFARRIAPYAEALHGPQPMEAVVAFEHGLGLEPYADVEGLERRVRAFDPAVVLGVWNAALTTPPAELTAISEALLPRITSPLLSLHGSQPEPGYADWLTGLAPQATVEVWDGTGHLLHLVDPQRFATRVASFVG